jgi:hypothetical protein
VGALARTQLLLPAARANRSRLSTPHATHRDRGQQDVTVQVPAPLRCTTTELSLHCPFFRNKKRRGEDTPQMHFCTFVRTHPHLRARRESALGLLSAPVCTQVLSCTGQTRGSALFSLSFLSFRGRLQGGGPICGGKNVSGGTMPRCASHHADPSSDCSKAAGVWWRRRNRATRRIQSASLTD